MEEKDKDSEFKVVDRRRFVDTAEKDKESETKKEPKTEAQPKSAEDEKKASAQQSSQEKKEQGAEEHHTPPSLDFSSFIVSIATQALMMLGEIPNPETNLVSMNLSAAKQTIDVLGLLQQKTKGNLTEEEVKLFEDVLASLRLAFVGKLNKSK